MSTQSTVCLNKLDSFQVFNRAAAKDRNDVVRKFFAISGWVLLGVAVSSIFIHPFGPVKAARSSMPLFQGAQVELPVFDIVKRSCRNCHSEQTVWPWYSYVAPVQWLIEKDVRDARGRFNMSRWDEYTAEEQAQILAEISYMIKNQKMPLPRYLFMHPVAKLQTQDAQLIDQWEHKERKRVKAEADRQNQGPPVEFSPL